MLAENAEKTLKHLRNSVSWRTTELKYKIQYIKYLLRYKQQKDALRYIEETQIKTERLRNITNQLITQLQTELLNMRKQICPQP